MNNRWHMNRIGFVNFWLYDEETFSFADGKLLLRGQNGSGKSITTQSFIPFILDGDRTPSRLDPFGSSDRRMEYYFLGESDREEATGYLFLEFKRSGVEQYRTIGIGQRAQRGKPMSFWGFVILDGRRIGTDLNLYREVGARKIPYTKQEMKLALGEENPFTEKPKEYMALVNKHIFGFPRMEQYEQFIRLLIKVRAPKLSKEFKPTKVYEVLNDSLQTLSDEDLRAMVEAMEKMDDIQVRLDNLKSSFKELQAIRNEYVRYNRYMLGNKAQAYLDEKKKADGIRTKLHGDEAELKSKQTEIGEREKDMAALSDKIYLLESEKQTLKLDDIESAVDKLEFAKTARREAEAEKARLEEKIENSRSQIHIYDDKLRMHQGTMELREDECRELLEQLEEENEVVLFELHDEVLRAPLTRDGIHAFEEALKNLERRVEQGVSLQKSLRAAQGQWDEEEQERQRLLLELQDLKSQLEAAERMEGGCRDEVIEAFYILSSQNQEFLITRRDLDELVPMVQRYGGAKDFGTIQGPLNQIWKSQRDKLDSGRLKLESARDASREVTKRLKEELERLRAMKNPVPERKTRTDNAREILRQKGISFLPFYEAVDFAEGLSMEAKNRIEGQLLDAGLLDALVVPAKDYAAARGELQGLSDVLIRASGAGGKPYPYLVAAPEDGVFQEMTLEILSRIRKDHEAEAELVLAGDGYFRNGVLEGYSHSNEEASFVGAAARQQKKTRMIAAKQEELGAEEEKLSALGRELEQAEERIEKLEEEYGDIPRFEDLDQAIDLVKTCREEVDKCKVFLEKQDALTDRLKEEVKGYEQQIIKVCKGLPYTRKLEDYQEVWESVREYRDSLTGLERAQAALERERENKAHVEEMIEREEQALDTDYGYLSRAKRTVSEQGIQIRRIEEFLDDPKTREKAERMRRLKEGLTEAKDQVQNHGVELAVLRSKVESLGQVIAELKEESAGQMEREEQLREYFEEELALGLVMERETEPVYASAVKASKCIRDGDRGRSGIEMTTSLMKTFQTHISMLSSYGTSLEECFADAQTDASMLRTRQRIVSVWNGKKLYLEEFYMVIKESIESTELLIQQKDRELFEDILADTLSRKLNGRISESRAWIKDMSALMQQMDTSMALTFSLEWKPGTAQSESELDTQELEKILRRDRDVLTAEDIEKVSAHFRSKIYMAKLTAEENGEIINYMDLVRDALDYRKWFEFRMYYYRNKENKKELTNAAFNRFSGGEKAMAMYVPLFAAVNAQYKKAEHKDHPRIIALDEAFAGVDDKNISSMFELVEKLEYDYIMNSQVLWGCYETVKSIRIAELLRPANSNVVTAIYYYWNGRERVLDEQ